MTSGVIVPRRGPDHPERMESLYTAPLNEIAAALLALVGTLSAVRGARAVARGLREARSLELIRGIRACVVARAAATFAAGALLAHGGLVVVGLVFLAEELYETGVLALIIRSGERSTTSRR
jgi:hypothetical protein